MVAPLDEVEQAELASLKQLFEDVAPALVEHVYLQHDRDFRAAQAALAELATKPGGAAEAYHRLLVQLPISTHASGRPGDMSAPGDALISSRATGSSVSARRTGSGASVHVDLNGATRLRHWLCHLLGSMPLACATTSVASIMGDSTHASRSQGLRTTTHMAQLAWRPLQLLHPLV